MSDQREREAALSRRFGMKPESVEKLRDFNEAQTDWYATCRKCGTRLEGTLADIRKGCTCGKQGQ